MAGRLISDDSAPQHVGERWQGLVGVVVALLCAACPQGYPTEDVRVENPFDMAQARRIEFLNELGSQAHDTIKWRYALGSGCLLSVGQRRAGTEWTTTHHRLDEVLVEIRFDRGNALHHLELAPAGAAEAQSVLHSADRWQAQQGSLLVKLIKRDCGTERRSSAP